MLRALGRTIDTTEWVWFGRLAGQLLFRPPSVAGWDDTRWLDTGTFNGRFSAVSGALRPYALKVARDHGKLPFDAAWLVDRAIAFWGKPTLSSRTVDVLRGFAAKALGDAKTASDREIYPIFVTNGLRQLVALSPEFQTS
jgi:hypothetical protein